MSKQNWSREELILAFNLYCKTPFGKIHVRNPDIIALADLLHRTPSAVSWKLANFARLDPSLRARNITGASHGSKEEISIWNEFNDNWEKLGFESEKLLADKKGELIEDSIPLIDADKPIAGADKERVVLTRVNQHFFRVMVLAAYNNECCITGLSVLELLNASHIIPWSVDKENRVNPQNGLCLNVLHDRAFDRGLITITTDYKVKISPRLKARKNDEPLKRLLAIYDGAPISLPDRFVPDPNFLKYHNENVFQQN